jgi:hypothetical protein
LTLAIVAVATLAATAPAQQTGTFALYAKKSHVVSKFWAVGQGPTQSLKVRQYGDDGTPVLHYGIDMGGTMHYFIVRDDFSTFKHYSAAFSMDGTFSHDFTRDAGHNYYLFADSHPVDSGRQVFRFDIGNPAASGHPSMTASGTDSSAGPYSVIFSKTTLAANTPYMMLVTIDRDGKGAQDLSPYFGGAAHMVMIQMSSLDYVELHPTLRGQKLDKSQSYTVEQEIVRLQTNSQVGPNQQVEIPALPAGTYKVWYEFTGGVTQHKYAAPFTLVVQ